MRLLALSALLFFSVSVSSQQFSKIDSTIQSLIDGNKIPGGVAMVWQDGRIVYQKVYGWKNPGHSEVMTLDAMFRITSQTKLIISIAALQLVEKNKLYLDSPIEKWIPEFSQQLVAVKRGDSIELLSREKSITLRHLFSHTSGISSIDEWPQFSKLFKDYGLDQSLQLKYKSLEQEVFQIAQMPLVHQPGMRFSYGYSTDVLARWIEIVSGMKLSDYLKKNIFNPLKMVDTHFKIPFNDRIRLLPVSINNAEGKLVQMDSRFFPIDFPVNDNIHLESGAGGLVSTPQDYMNLLICLANDGHYKKGKSILSKRWIDSLCTGQLGGASFVTGGMRSPNTFGLGVGITTEAGSKVIGATPGSFFWGGAFNTSYLVDRQKRVITLFMFQRAPFDLPGKLSMLERYAFQALKQ
jgi:CubicO group peptidase (beta-lactamase class C family)